MKRYFTAGLSILAVMACAGWKVASQPESSSAGLENIRLIQSSEHSQPSESKALAGIRIRLSPTDFDGEIHTTGHAVPQIALAGEPARE